MLLTAKEGMDNGKHYFCKYLPKEICVERGIGDARNKNKFNMIIPFLPTAKQAIADSLQTGL